MAKGRTTEKRIEALFKEFMERATSGEKMNMYQYQLDKGYSHSSAKAYKLAGTKSWLKCLDKIDDSALANRLVDISKGGTDQNSIRAIQELFKLKGRYPKEGRGIGIKDEILELFEEGDYEEQEPKQLK